MKILYIGDIMGSFGRTVLTRELPGIRHEHAPDVVIAQAENVTHGRGINRRHYEELRQAGIHGFSSGNHIYAREDIRPLLDDPDHPITQPANYPAGTHGAQYKLLPTSAGNIALITLMGQIVGKDADVPADNPLQVVDAILDNLRTEAPVATLVNFHGDYSSEKVVIGQYLDGRVTAAVGDHWHIPTADARVLPGGTAHISDVGMVGALNASLGIKTDIIVRRWLGKEQGRNEPEQHGEYQFNSVIIDCDETSGCARHIEPVARHGKITELHV